LYQSLVEDGNLGQIKLSFKADDQILNLLDNVNSFGKIIIETKSSDLDIEADKHNQAQQRLVYIRLLQIRLWYYCQYMLRHVDVLG
jgi:hypothetical protein